MGDLVFPQEGPGPTQIRASQRVVGAPSPRPDPGPWLRPVVANIYICRVNSQEGAGLGRGGLWSLDPADLGGGFWREKPLGQKVGGGAQGHPQLLTPSQLRGDLNPAPAPSPYYCVDRQPLLPGLLSGGAQDTGQWGRLLRGHKARNCRWCGPCGGQGGAMRALEERALVGPLVCPGRLAGGGDMGAAAVGIGEAACVCVCVCARVQGWPASPGWGMWPQGSGPVGVP